MAKLEDITRGANVRGILANRDVTIVDVEWYGNAAIKVVYEDSSGALASEILYRDREPTLMIITEGEAWSFTADGAALRLASEAHRIHLAYLFDPILAVHTSLVEPLPHQITAVYEEMLPRQPLRFLLADDPGAGKTIMAGLFIKELIVRGDLRRCLICCPGNLVEQWQDEMSRKFNLDFAIISRQSIEESRTGNPFAEKNLVIGRLDHMSRNDEILAKLRSTEWDLIVCDEAHKMAASFYGNEISYTKRYRLGQALSGLCRHFLLMTATPHNGKEADFQLFMALLDGDRFEGRYRDGVHVTDASDMMRRLVKEDLLKFDGKPLFPERLAYAVQYALSPEEAVLYKEVTAYVREQFNRAEALKNKKRAGTVGFALTVLQRRLASSPAAIYESLKRRRERLEARLREEQVIQRGENASLSGFRDDLVLTDDEIEDLDDSPDEEIEETEEEIVSEVTAAQTIAELKKEIGILAGLEKLAEKLLNSGRDRKWDELSILLQDNAEMFDSGGTRRKLVIFTEHRDTLFYLQRKIQTVLGRPDAVVLIYGGMGREARRNAQESFTQNKGVQILLATDAAGEGINLQRANLMINYDLPWNPNRLEQRFGRIHRIGQTEVCHLWNLVAFETREGEVFTRLFQKLEEERKALGGRVYDVLGKVQFGDRRLRDLILEAIRYGESPEVRARLTKAVDTAFDTEHLKRLLEDKALAHDALSSAQVTAIREEMERAEARRLQPHFISSFFMEAFAKLGGTVRQREPKRYEVTHVPAVVRNRDRQIGTGEVVLRTYERITFEKELVTVPGKPLAAFVCPGHPLLDATIDLVLERYRDTLRRGAVLVDPQDTGAESRALFYLEHAVQDGRVDAEGRRRTISRRLEFVEMTRDGITREAGYAPYLDYRPLTDEERALVEDTLNEGWVKSNLEQVALAYAIEHIVPGHLDEVRTRRENQVNRIREAVHERLVKEITYWDHRAVQIRLQEEAGRTPKLNSEKARQRAQELQERLQTRLAELDKERQVSALPPVVIGGALVIPIGLLNTKAGNTAKPDSRTPRETAAMERIGMEAVMEAERSLGNTPVDVSARKCGYDIESITGDGRLRFIEVKGRVAGATIVTITRNEILTALNKPDGFILALALVDGDTVDLKYIRTPFGREPEFGVTSQNHQIAVLLKNAEEPN